MERITLILERKGAHLHTVSSESPITDALQQMRSENVDYLVVLNDNERFLGILTDHDIATKIHFRKKTFSQNFSERSNEYKITSGHYGRYS